MPTKHLPIADLVISGGKIVCMDKAMRVLDGYSIAIKDGMISAIYPSRETRYHALDFIDAHSCLIIPGLINAHTHLPMTYFRGVADDLPLMTWLEKYIWPLENRLVRPDFTYHASLHGAAEMLLGGVTLCNDMYFYSKQIAEACKTIGMRAVIGEAVIHNVANEAKSISEVGKLARSLREEYQDQTLLEFAIAPHSIYTCDRKLLVRCAEVAIDHDFLLHMHLSETAGEVATCLSTNGIKPVKYIKECGILDAKTILAHGVWIDDEEMALIAESGSSVVTCLESNLKLSSGIFPMQKYLAQKVNVCLGTDGVASNNNLDLFAEMDFNAKLHKQMAGDPSFLPAMEVLKMATINAAKALHLDHKLGSLEVGKCADLAILRTDQLQSVPIYNPYSHIVYSMHADSVRDVVVNGKSVVRNRNLTQVSLSEILERAHKYQDIVKHAL